MVSVAKVTPLRETVSESHGGVTSSWGIVVSLSLKFFFDVQPLVPLVGAVEEELGSMVSMVQVQPLLVQCSSMGFR